MSLHNPSTTHSNSGSSGNNKRFSGNSLGIFGGSEMPMPNDQQQQPQQSQLNDKGLINN
jgi:hypothetical protein